MSLHPAARVTDVFGHDATLAGIDTGVVIGALLAVGIIATGGLTAIAVGAALVTIGAGRMAGAAIGKTLDGPVTGQLQTGSANVFINALPAAMVEQATGFCSQDGGTAHRVATGSATVFINGKPAARVSETMDCGAVIRSGSSNVYIGGSRLLPICVSLRAEQVKLERFRIDAQAASAAYEPPETRTPPEGYRNATEADLGRLRLTANMLEHPIDPKTGEQSEFRAAVFIDQKTGSPLVAYKGTTMTSGGDWTVNAEQGLGDETFYYNHAQFIARQVATSPSGAGARLTGHSLGGGMASAGATASGLPATTFNAAGLNAKTVPHPVATNIDAVYVKGEPVRGIQSLPFSPDSAATKDWPLEPADRAHQLAVLALIPLGPLAVGGGLAIRNLLLHMMTAVDAAIAQKRAETERALSTNGCS